MTRTTIPSVHNDQGPDRAWMWNRRPGQAARHAPLGGRQDRQHLPLSRSSTGPCRRILIAVLRQEERKARLSVSPSPPRHAQRGSGEQAKGRTRQGHTVGGGWDGQGRADGHAGRMPRWWAANRRGRVGRRGVEPSRGPRSDAGSR